MNKNTIIITIASIFVTFLLLFGVYKLTNEPIQTNFPQTKQLRANDNIKWSKDKKNLLVEYSDFQCPACKSAHDVLKTIDASITKKVTFAFRHYPLTQIHNKALAAAYASEAATKQGKFWEMSDLLFNNQLAWEKSNDPLKDYFVVYAADLKLNIDQFKKDFDSTEVKDKVNQDMQEANDMKLDSTPTFFLNGQKLDIRSYNELKVLLKDL